MCVCVYFCGSGLLQHKLKKYFYPKKASWSPAEPRRVERAVCNEKGALEVERVHARAESDRRESEGSCSRRLGMNQQRAYLTPSTTSTCRFRTSVHPPPADFTLDDFISRSTPVAASKSTNAGLPPRSRSPVGSSDV